MCRVWHWGMVHINVCTIFNFLTFWHENGRLQEKREGGLRFCVFVLKNDFFGQIKWDCFDFVSSCLSFQLTLILLILLFSWTWSWLPLGLFNDLILKIKDLIDIEKVTINLSNYISFDDLLIQFCLNQKMIDFQVGDWIDEAIHKKWWFS